ncbi:MAG: TRAM domain-containing protein, partial [Saprospiraceae bacterium]|nr:TRAM domain-containing protein [Saprospiraceae bacterium]
MARRSKNQILEKVRITGIADKGKAVGRTHLGEVVFVDDAVPGDLVDVRVIRKKKSLAEGVVIQFQELSLDRVTPSCRHFGICGGCKWQHLDYQAQ